MQRRLVLGGILAAALGAGGIGLAAAASSGSASAAPPTGTGTGGYGPDPSASSSPPGTAQPSTVATRSTAHGRVITDGAGRTLYLFEADSGTSSACDGWCAAVWPPLAASGAVQVSGGASAELLGSIHRADGTTQVTYDGHPLYYYAGDHEPGDTAGQGLKQFGAAWYVLDPQGAKIDDD